MAKQTIAGAEQGVALTRDGDEWSWNDGLNNGSGFGSAVDALQDYLSNPLDPSERFVPVSCITIETRFQQPTPADPAGPGTGRG